MKRFILNIALLAGMFSVVLFMFELFMLTVPNRYSYKYKYVEQHLNDIQVLLLGNCHIEDGLKPEVIGNGTFNMAISGREIVYDVELAKRFIPKMSNLKVVLIQLDYRSFGLGREKANPRDYKKHGGHESTFKCMYTKYMNMKVDGWWYWSELINSELNYTYRIWLSRPDQIECDSLGFISLKDDNKVEKWQYWDLPKIYDIAIHLDQDKYNELYFQYQTIANLCSKGIRFILVTTPMLKTYQDDMVPQVEIEMMEFVSRLQKDFPNIEYYDFTRDERFSSQDFHDASHLSETGSQKFSKIIRDVIAEKS